MKAPQKKTRKRKTQAINIYSWEAVNARGEKVAGEFQGTSLSLAKAYVRNQGLVPRKIRKKSKSLFAASAGKRIKAADIAIFSRQMATMLDSGIALVQSLDIVASNAKNPRLHKMLVELKESVESGDTFAKALKNHPKYFSNLFCNLVEAGEQSGSLENMLERVATYQEKLESVKSKIKKAMIYPASVLVVAFLVTIALMIFVVPQFESLFKGFGADLPVPTKIVISISEFLQRYWYIIIGSMVGGAAFLMHMIRTSPPVAYAFDKTLLRLPILGNILRDAIIARFTRTLGVTFAAGLPLVDALTAVSGATGNILYTHATLQIRDKLAAGTRLQNAMRATNLFPNMVMQMIGIGEESGALESMLNKVADYYEGKVDDSVDNLSSLMEPVILVFLAVIVGGLVLSMYLPVFKLGSVT